MIYLTNGDFTDGHANIFFELLEFAGDPDGDGIINGLDNCPYLYNPDQLDENGNGIGDACEEMAAITVAEEQDMIARSVLRQNEPNPFNPRTSIAYSVPCTSPVTVSIHDVHGRLVATLLDRVQPAGEHRCSWDGRDGTGREVTGGVYFCCLKTGEGVLSRERVLSR